MGDPPSSKRRGAPSSGPLIVLHDHPVVTDAGSFATVANLRCLLVPRRYKQFLADHSRKVSEAFTQYRVRYRGRGSCQLRARRARGLPGPARLNGVTRSGRRHARSFELMTFFDFVIYVLRKGQLNRHTRYVFLFDSSTRRVAGFLPWRQLDK
jgi:hypothetical protein